ncbi:hypothetical protein [Robertkochia sediminum]|uniref:hypothetical protein n=1 Tax=Robertkochia sediminum TaxID=2785326 RepID=UPI00193390F4|nr:hypothetical protein [Robertkochia sediminum]MBL7473392.1 hypothetical protein [Robertkochia sediminum]
MPFVEEKHLIDIHRHLEEKELSEQRLAEEVKRQRELNKTYRQRTTRLAWCLALLILILAASLSLFITKPGVFYNETHFQAENKVILEQQQWVQLQEALDGRSEEVNRLKHTLESLDYRALDDEVVYTVQVAALVKERVPLVSEELMNLNIYKDLPYTKYTMGRFTDVKDARQLRKALIDLGFKNAFVVSYKKDKRLKIIDPLAYE